MKTIQNKRNLFFVLSFAFLAAGIFCGCKEKEDLQQEQQPNTVRVLTYNEYIATEMITDFQMKTGHKLELEVYDAQEEIPSKLQAADSNFFDIIIASDVVIPQLIRQGIIAPIDTNKVPNRINIADNFKSPTYDPSNTYTLPYLWGTTGILYRDSSIDVNNASYKMLFDKDQIKGRYTLLDEAQSLLSIALLAAGFKANSTDPKEINKAVNFLLQAKKDKRFAGIVASEECREKILSGHIWAAIVFNGEAMDAINEDSTLQYAIPTEGSFMWVDAMTLGSHARNVEGAHAFMNYVLEANIGARLAKSVNFATPNKASLEILDDTFKNNRVINPTKEEIDRMVFLNDPGDAAKIFDDAWKIVKSK